ncbi:hypothetical protein EYR40_010017 [Pleurotus pulmonarius]|nr:hypothetical protein EYR40_010017 [Pleurotus pulmonarius]
MPSFANFLNTCYSPEECDARGLTSPKTSIANPDTNPPTTPPPPVVNPVSPLLSTPPIVTESIPASAQPLQALARFNAATVKQVQPGPTAAIPTPLARSTGPAVDPAQPAAIVGPAVDPAQPAAIVGPAVDPAQQPAAIVGPAVDPAQQPAAIVGPAVDPAQPATIEMTTADVDMSYAWHGFDFSNFDMSAFNFTMPNPAIATATATNGASEAGNYPSLMQELAMPLPDSFAPQLPSTNHLLSNTLYLSPPGDYTSVNHGLPVMAIGAAALAHPALQTDPVLSAPAPKQVSILEHPALPVEGPLPDVPPANDAAAVANTPLVATPRANTRKRVRDEPDPNCIVDSKRVRKSVKRTEIEALTDNLPKGKENRPPRRRH